MNVCVCGKKYIFFKLKSIYFDFATGSERFINGVTSTS